MKNINVATCISLITFNVVLSSSCVRAADFALSPDSSAVVRLVPSETVSANSLNTSLLPAGWTANTGTGGTLTVNSYNAGFKGSSGGAKITALFDNGTAPSPKQYLEWVQVLDTNLSLGGKTSPYLDNAINPKCGNAANQPFYSCTAANLTSGLPASQINFYDFSRRDQSSIAKKNPLTWNAKLYPVIANASNVLTVYDGVSWGWTMKKATVGEVTGSFTDPSPSSAVVSGVGTLTFSWGAGDPSSLSFAGTSFDTKPNTVFKLGTLTFHNGTITSGTAADSVTLNTQINFDNISEKNFALSSKFTLTNTLNNDDPIASADQVSLGSLGYTFNVLEGNTASVNMLAKLMTDLSRTLTGVKSGTALSNERGIHPSPNYRLTIVGFSDPTIGGFVTTRIVPEPSNIYSTVISGMILLLMRIFWSRRGIA